MSAYQQARKNESRKDKPIPDIQTESSPSVQKTVLCPNCNAGLPETALFCPECGFSTGHHCPKCGAPAPAIADICETCGAWLLEGQCKFCYAEIPDGAVFCPECGKPKEGIPCPHCGNLSIFDFCKNCGKPVTEEAIAELQRAQDEILNTALSGVSETAAVAEPKTFASNQEARRWYNAHNPSTLAQTDGVKAELARLETIINSKPETESEKTEDTTPSPPPPPEPKPLARKSLFSDKQLASIRKTGAVVDTAIYKREEEAKIAEEKRREEARIANEKRKAEEERRRKEEERQRQIKEAQERKESLERALRPRGWRCNAYGVIHPGGPSECAGPYGGGQWV